MKILKEKNCSDIVEQKLIKRNQEKYGENEISIERQKDLIERTPYQDYRNYVNSRRTIYGDINGIGFCLIQQFNKAKDSRFDEENRPIFQHHGYESRWIGELEAAKKLAQKCAPSFGINGNGNIYTAINYAVYDFGYDYHNQNIFLAVIQVRQTEGNKKKGRMNIKKSYFLAGKNEIGTFFSHAVESRVIHNAIKKGEKVLYAVQSWIFDYDYKSVVRQGDIALVPCKKLPALKHRLLTTRKILVNDSHILDAPEIWIDNNKVVAVDPKLIHAKNQHDIVERKGQWKITVGKRVMAHDFSLETKD